MESRLSKAGRSMMQVVGAATTWRETDMKLIEALVWATWSLALTLKSDRVLQGAPPRAK